MWTRAISAALQRVFEARTITEPKKVCVITGSRADYGLLQPIMKALKADRCFTLQTMATAALLEREFGFGYKEIEADGFSIDAKVKMLNAADTGVGTAKSMGAGTAGVAEALSKLKPDIVMLLGDRFEALAAAQAALVMNIPIAHLSGGDLTEGAFDDAMRHAITKMSHLHFVASKDSANRVKQLGENPRTVFAVGDPGLDNLRTMKLFSRRTLERDLEFRFLDRNLLLTFHPVTLDRESSAEQFSNLLAALDDLGSRIGLIFTRPNADPEGRKLITMLDEYVETRENASAFASLGRRRYLSVMAQCDAVVGNSSSGLLEAPALRKPTLNIGSRQAGRLRPSSVIDCTTSKTAIARGLKTALNSRIGRVKNPYGDGRATERVIRELKRIEDPKALLQKKFHDL